MTGNKYGRCKNLPFAAGRLYQKLTANFFQKTLDIL